MKNINKETSEFIYSINQIDLIDIYKIFHLIDKGYIFFSTAHRPCCKTDPILVHKSDRTKYGRVKRISCILPDHIIISLRISSKNYRNSTGKWRLVRIFFKELLLVQGSREEINNFLESNENKSTT